jgi:formate/nitrite transporter FocA (FNT family)
VLLHVLGHDRVGESVAYLGHSLGFLIVIIGRQQLFTENTLFPVALVLAQGRYLARTARLWGVVLVGNVVGTLLFALLATRTRALSLAVAAELATLGVDGATQPFWTIFWTGFVGPTWSALGTSRTPSPAAPRSCPPRSPAISP